MPTPGAVAIAFVGFIVLDLCVSWGRWLARKRAKAIAIVMGHPDVAQAIEDIDV